MTKRTSKVIGIIIGIMLFIGVIGGITYAWVTYRTGNVTISGNTACFNINYSSGQDMVGKVGTVEENLVLNNNTITINNAMAISSVNISLDSSCTSVNGLGTIELNVTSLPNSFMPSGTNEYALKYVLAEYNPAVDGSATLSNMIGKSFNYIKKASITSSGRNDIYTDYLEPGEGHNYLIIMYIDSNFLNGTLDNSNFQANITARGEQFVPTPISDFEYYLGSYSSPNGEVTIPSNQVFLTRYIGSDTTVNVPSTYIINGTEYSTALYGYQARSTDDCQAVFKDNTTIQQVNFANDVLIASNNYASSTITYGKMIFTFMGCTSLTKVTNIPSSVMYLLFTFRDCPSLTDVLGIHNTNNSVLVSTFYNCTSLVNAPVLPSTITNMQQGFQGCTSLVNAPEIPSSVTNMLQTFYDCNKLRGMVKVNSSNVSNNANTFVATAMPIKLYLPANSTTYTTFTTTNIPANNVTIITY